MSMSEPGPVGLALMLAASVAILTAVAVQNNHLNGQVATSKDAVVTDVQAAQIDRSTGTLCAPAYMGALSCSTDIDIRPASIVITSAGRYMVEGTWPGLAGETVQLRTMRGGRFNLCRADGRCDEIQR